nr:hypothetical protein [Cupriavidus sp. D39]
MTKILSDKSTNEVALQGAILLYGPRPSEFSYATAHVVTLDDKSQRPTIGAGTPLNRRALIHAVTQVAAATLPKGSF